MSKISLLIAFLVSFLSASPAMADDSYPSDCMIKRLSPDLVTAMADDKLSEREERLGRKVSESDKQASEAAHFECIELYKVPSDQHCDFFVANSAHVLKTEFRQRLERIGIDMPRVEALIQEVNDNPGMALGARVIDDPNLFGRPIDAVAEAHGIDVVRLVWLILEYVGSAYSQSAAEEALLGNESVCSS